MHLRSIGIVSVALCWAIACGSSDDAADTPAPASDDAGASGQDAESGRQVDAASSTPSDSGAAAPPLRPCAELSPAPAFCMDFDDGLTVAWKDGVKTTVSAPVDTPGSVAALGTPGFTGPSHLSLTSGGQDAGQPSGDAYYTLASVSGQRAHLHGALRLTYSPFGSGATDESGYVVALLQLFGSSEAEFARADVALSSSSAAFTINILGSSLAPITKKPVEVPIPPAGEWVAFDVDFSVGALGAVEATLTVGNASGTARATTTNTLSQAKFGVLGLAPIDSTGPVALDLDNITFGP